MVRIDVPRLAVLFAGCLGLLGCELIAKIRDRSYSPVDDGGHDARVRDIASCTLMGVGEGALRFGHLLPSAVRIDVCLRPSNSASFAGVTPLFASAGPDCALGLPYKAITRAIAVAPDTYEVKLVAAGARDCEGPGIASLPQALAQAGQPAAVYLLGNGRDPPSVRRLAESRPDAVHAAALRLVVATDDFGRVDFGPLKQKSATAEYARRYLTQVAFGDPIPDGKAEIRPDANGYIADTSIGGSVFYGAGPAGEAAARVGLPRQVALGAAYTFFLTGRTDVPDFPVELLACEETARAGILVPCSDAPPVTLTVSAIDLVQTGVFSPHPMRERRAAAPAAIAALESDVACITDVYEDSDKDAIIEAAKGRFPFAFYPKTTWDSAVEDPTDASGSIPSPITTAACADSRAALNRAVDCLRDHCSSNLGSESATAPDYQPAKCMGDHCYAELVELVTAHNVCWSCLFAQYASYETMAEIRRLCSEEPKATTLFRGRSPSLLLSRYPIRAPEHRILPGDGWRSAVIRAPITIDNGAPVDVYCGTATAVYAACETYFPTPSRYGAGASNCVESFRNEQRLHFTKIRDFVATRSGTTGTRAILSGMFSAGPPFGSTIASVEAENFAILSSAFSLGAPPGYEPRCTDCADNPLRGATDPFSGQSSYWTTFNMLQRVAVTDIASLDIVLKEPIVVREPDVRVPLSTRYGITTRIRIAP